MFHNRFERNERFPGPFFRQWVNDLPICDISGNEIIADHRLNLVVVFLAGGRGFHGNLYYTFDVKNGAVFPVEDERHQRYEAFIPRKHDVLMVFHPDCSHDEFPLGPGEAERILIALRNEPDAWCLRRSLIVALPQVYSSNASQETVGRLRAVLTEE